LWEKMQTLKLKIYPKDDKIKLLFPTQYVYLCQARNSGSQDVKKDYIFF